MSSALQLSRGVQRLPISYIMSKPLGSIALLIAVSSIGGLRNKVRTHRYLSTKHCGSDALSAYLSCTANTVCSASEDCKEGESCFAVDCPLLVQTQDQNVLSTFETNTTNSTANETLSNETLIGTDVLSIFETNTTNSTANETLSNETSLVSTDDVLDVFEPSNVNLTDVDETSSNATSSLSTTSSVVTATLNDNTTAVPLNETQTISATVMNASIAESTATASPTASFDPTSSPTSAKPTTSPTETIEDWTNFDYSENKKFCGPKVVGGYDIAVSQCGPLTICGVSIISDHYGSSGNDCPHSFMCYSDIKCGNGPGPKITTTSTSEVVTSTSTIEETEATSGEVSDVVAEEKSTTTSSSSATASEASPEVPTTEILTTTSTTPYNPILFTTRAAFCGSFYAEAVRDCGTKTMCTSSADCNGEEECFENVSCTYDPNIVADDDDGDENRNDDDEADKEEDAVSPDMEGNESQGIEDEEDISFAENEDENLDSNAAANSNRVALVTVGAFLCSCWHRVF